MNDYLRHKMSSQHVIDHPFVPERDKSPLGALMNHPVKGDPINIPIKQKYLMTSVTLSHFSSSL